MSSLKIHCVNIYCLYDKVILPNNHKKHFKMRKNILKSTLFVLTLSIAGYGCVKAYEQQQKKVNAMSDFLLQNVEALAQDMTGGDDTIKPKKEYVMVVDECGVCCSVLPSQYPDKPNDKKKTGNPWQTCKREERNDRNKDSKCTTLDCPGDEIPYMEP